MKKLSLLFVLFITISTARAQDYNNGIGLRLGGISSGITFKHFMNSDAALEGILGWGRHAIFITGLYEKHAAFGNAQGLYWFYGGGAHIGFYNDDYGYAYFRYYKKKNVVYVNENYHQSNISLGGDFILGLEYKFDGAPLTLGLDVKPVIDIVPGFYGYFDGAFTVRFTF
ncbi:MAG: hypothetical protein IPP51_18770 [Bacteroidetes bacterium]|nr:hypothetical protein [Bacteroidota bacterium]